MEHKRKSVDGMKIKSKRIPRDISPPINLSHTEDNKKKDDFFVKTFEDIDKDFLAKPKIKTKKRKTTFLKNRFFKLFLFLGFVFGLFSFLHKTTIHLRANDIYKNIRGEIIAELYPKKDQLGFDVISVVESEDILVVPETEQVVEKKASGLIRVFNNYSTEPQRLIEGTRFEAVGGKIFKIPEGVSVVVPGKSGEIPGSADVLVYAAEPGPEYNIDLTDFSIPGFIEAGLTDKYSGMYALSVNKMSGGEIGVEKILTEEQEQLALVELNALLLEKLENRIRAEKTNQFFLVEDASLVSFGDVERVAEGENIRISRKVRGSNLILSKENLEMFILNNFFEAEEAVAIKSYENMSLKNISDIDFDQLQKIKIKFSVDVIYNHIFTKERITMLFIEKDKDEIPLLIDKDLISFIDINIFPFWRKKTSSVPEKFRIHILE